MTITQTIEIPANRRQMTIDVPREIPAGRTILTFTPAPEGDLHDCPLCAKFRDPESGALRPNAETIAAIEESRKTSTKLYNSLEEMLVDLDADD